jgi:hypothetical protein
MPKSPLDVLDAEIAALTSTLRRLKSARAALCRHLALLNRAPNKRLKKAAKRAKALKPNASPPIASKPKPGDRMPDGTVYVGISPNMGRPLYAMTRDLPRRYSWTYAIKITAQQTVGGHTDWRLPTKDELNMLYLAQKTIGSQRDWRFRPDWYWSNSECSPGPIAWSQGFDYGSQCHNLKSNAALVRCVRSG